MDSDEDMFDSSADLFGDVEEHHETDCHSSTTDSQPVFPIDNATRATTHDIKPPIQFEGSILLDSKDTLQASNSSTKSALVQPEDSSLLDCFQERSYKEYLHSSPNIEIDEVSEKESLLGLPSKRYKVCESKDEVENDSDFVMGGNSDNCGILNVSSNSLHNLNGGLPEQTAEKRGHTDTSAQRQMFQTESSRPSPNAPVNSNASLANNLCNNNDPGVHNITSTSDNNGLINFNQLPFDKNANGIDQQGNSSSQPNIEDLRSHVKTHANDETVYGISETHQQIVFSGPSSPPKLACPVCSLEMIDADLLTSHVESHFNPLHRPGSDSVSSSRQVVNQGNVPVEKKSLKQNLNHSWQEAQAKAASSQGVPSTSRDKWKMEFNGRENMSYKQQFEQNLEQAVARGKMTVSDYHEQRILMAETELMGVDNGTTRTQGLIEKLDFMYKNQARAGQVAHLCSPVDHFAGSFGDKGWGCGYRNFQMMLSCLSRNPDYARRIFTGGNASIPSIPKIQQMIEQAWNKGFDPPGCRQLGGSLINTSKWIGATEIVATLSSLGIKCLLVDFPAPSAPDGSHPHLLEWVNNYFCRPQQCFLPPLYLQHQGHSRIIVGVDIEHGAIKLLLFDPGTPSDQMACVARNKMSWKYVGIFRRAQSGFKAAQYQIVSITGLLTDAEYEESKTLKSEQVF